MDAEQTVVHVEKVYKTRPMSLFCAKSLLRLLLFCYSATLGLELACCNAAAMLCLAEVTGQRLSLVLVLLTLCSCHYPKG